MTDPLLAQLRLDLADSGHEPMTTRLTDRIWEGVVGGEIAAGERLPTLRELAVTLSTSPRTVRRAYEQLERLGVVEARPGEGTFVSLAPPPEEEHRRQRALGDIAREAVERARALGYAPDDLLEAVADWRGTEPEPRNIP
ncbi:GntR family transcriptional regulator [soil metagenome]